MTELISKLNTQISQFFEIYSILSPEGKAAFEGQMGPMLNSSDTHTRSLYQSLLQSAKNGLSIEEAIEKLNELSAKNNKTIKS